MPVQPTSDLMTIKVISMPNAKARRARIERYFAESPYLWQFMDASDGTAAFPPYDAAKTLAVAGRELTRPEIGAAQSHVIAVKDFLEHGAARVAMVCEDDVFVDFDYPFADLVQAMEEAGVDYLRLHTRRAPPARHVQYWRNRWLVRYRWEPLGMQAYLVTRRGAQRILDAVPAIYREIDQQYDRFWENGLIPYSLHPHPVIELTAPTSFPVRNPHPTRLHHYRHRIRRLIDRVAAIIASFTYGRQDRAFAAALLRADERAKSNGG